MDMRKREYNNNKRIRKRNRKQGLNFMKDIEKFENETDGQQMNRRANSNNKKINTQNVKIKKLKEKI